jgi:hypothetical protein
LLTASLVSEAPLAGKPEASLTGGISFQRHAFLAKCSCNIA